MEKNNDPRPQMNFWGASDKDMELYQKDLAEWEKRQTPQPSTPEPGDWREEFRQCVLKNDPNAYLQHFDQGAEEARDWIHQNVVTPLTSQIEEMRKDGWVSVKDGLPESGEPCLLWHKSQITYVIGFYSQEMFHFNHSHVCVVDKKHEPQDSGARIIDVNPKDISHWQPLPNPPKEK